MADGRNVGVIGRADHGGLAAQTYEVWRHLRPCRTLVIDMGRNTRGGAANFEKYDAPWCETIVAPLKGDSFPMERFVDGLDVIYTAETAYSDRLYEYARQAGTAVVLHLNPELFWRTDKAADVLWNPTHWRTKYLPDRTEVVAMPVALDVLPYRRRTKVEVLFHSAGEAMLDRNGTEIVYDMLRRITTPVTLLVRGGPPPPTKRIGKATVEWLPLVDSYEKAIPDEADLLVMPRRYGGLCLPLQEAAARGIPSIMSAVSPQNSWLGPDLLVNAEPRRRVSMRGGDVDVYDTSAVRFAQAVQALIDSPARVAQASDSARSWAQRRSWDALLPDWQTRLAAAQPRRR